MLNSTQPTTGRNSVAMMPTRLSPAQHQCPQHTADRTSQETQQMAGYPVLTNTVMRHM